ncbi:MAG TPA: glycosyltransferase family 1 protein, partial [Marinobacter hydrocarbonoclasticus]|nr:glycosyltransferase family 1 protein [Marinobacter nauticus]
MPASELWFVVPGDPGQNTGGYRYVRRLVEVLVKAGIPVKLAGLEGAFPKPDDFARQSLDRFLAGLPDGTRVVLDGLAMSGLPEVLQRHQSRLNLMALVHHPLADENGLSEQEQAWFKHSETTALACVGAVFTTSHYTAERLQAFGVTPARVTTALPAVDDAFFQQSPRIGRRDATRAIHLLCVGHLSPRKAQHQLIQALAQLTHLDWRLRLVGSAGRATDYASGVRALVRESGLESRVEFA